MEFPFKWFMRPRDDEEPDDDLVIQRAKKHLFETETVFPGGHSGAFSPRKWFKEFNPFTRNLHWADHDRKERRHLFGKGLHAHDELGLRRRTPREPHDGGGDDSA